MSAERKYFGKYRGTVISNIDPMQLGRITAIVPDVTGDIPSTWAMPCFTIGGTQNGLFTVPTIGSNVWIEYEGGDPDYPIWVGCFYGTTGDIPGQAKACQPPLQQFFLQTQSQNVLMVSDLPGPAGGILLKTASGAMIAINDVGITIANGKGATISMTGPTTDVNGGALTVV